MTESFSQWSHRVAQEAGRIKKGCCPNCGIKTNQHKGLVQCLGCCWSVPEQDFHEDLGYMKILKEGVCG